MSVLPVTTSPRGRSTSRARARAAAEGLSNFAASLLFGFGALIALIAAGWIAGAIGAPLSDDAAALLQWLYTR
jgi:hypothetical protein